MLSIRNFYCAFMGLAFLALVGCSEDPKATLERAQLLEANGDLIAATLELKSAIQQDPKNAEMRLMLGQLYLRQYAAPSAIKELERALDLGISEKEVATVALAHAYFRANAYAGLAEITIDDGFSAVNKASILAMQGHAKAREKDIPEARKKLDEARGLHAESVEARFLAAQLKLYERDIDAAYAELDAVIAADPVNEIAHTFKATVARANEQRDIELASCDVILENYPDNFNIRVARSNARIANGDLEGARADVAYLEKKFPRLPKTLVQSGLLKLADGDPAGALDLAREALSGAADLSDANLLAGLAHKELGSITQAGEFITEFIRAVPNNLYARRLLAEVRLKQGDPKAALQIIEPLIQLGYEDPTILNLGAVAKQALGDKKTAGEWFDKAVQLAPDDPKYAQTKALAAVAGGDVESGLRGLEAALENSANASAADEVVILTLLQRKELERAEKILKNLEQKNPDSPLVSNLRGLFEVTNGKPDLARAAFERARDLDPNLLAAVTNLAELDAREGKIDDAIKGFQTYIDSNGRVVPAYLSLATLQIKFGRQEAALTTLEKAVSVDPDDLSVVMPLLGEYFESNRERDAEKVAFIALKSHPDDAALIAALAEAELRSGAKNKAMTTMERVLSLPDRTAQTYVELAQFQFRAGKPNDAERTLRDGLRTYPGAAPLHFQLMAMFSELRQFDNAATHVKEVQKERPDAPFGYLIEGEMFEVMGEHDKATAAYDQALERQPAGPFAVKRFNAYRNIDATVAQQWLSDWVDSHPAEAAARARLADELARGGNYKAAISHYERLVAEKTFQVATLNGLAWAYYSVGDDRAQTVAEAAYLQGGFSPYVADTLGWILVEKGDVDGGLPYLEKAAQRAPNDADIRLHYAIALQRASQRDKAKAEALAIKDLELPPANASALEDLLDQL